MYRFELEKANPGWTGSLTEEVLPGITTLGRGHPGRGVFVHCHPHSLGSGTLTINTPLTNTTSDRRRADAYTLSDIEAGYDDTVPDYGNLTSGQGIANNIVVEADD